MVQNKSIDILSIKWKLVRFFQTNIEDVHQLITNEMT